MVNYSRQPRSRDDIPALPRQLDEELPADLRGRSLADSGMCMAVLDPELYLLEANAGLLRLFDQPAHDILGQPFGNLLHPSVQEQVLARFVRLTTGQRDNLETRAVLLQGTGSIFSGRLTAVVVESQRKTIRSIITVVKPDDVFDVVFEGADSTLTGIDAKILEGVAAGVATAQLASRLYLSKQGVEYHVGMMLRKFEVPNRTALVAKAYSSGIFSVGSWPPKILVDRVR